NGGPVKYGKWVFLQAVKDLIPESSYNKPKRGFSMPYMEWLRGPLSQLVDDVLSDGVFRSSGLLEPREVDRLLNRFRAGREPRWARVWTVMMLGLWFRGLKSRGRSVPVFARSSSVYSLHDDTGARG